MPKSRVIDYRFTRGELDPKLNGRADLDQYYSTGKTLQNILPLPQGGVTRRPGLEYIDEAKRVLTQYATGSITPSAPNGGTAGNANDDNDATVLLTTNNIGTVDPYVVVEFDLGSAQSVTFVDVEGVTLTSGTSTEFRIQYSDDASTWTNHNKALLIDTTSRDYRLRLDVSTRYVRLSRVGSTDLGTAKAQIADMKILIQSATLSESTLISFEFNDEQEYLLVFTDQNMAVYRGGVFQIDVSTGFVSSQLSTMNCAQSADTGIFVHQDVAPQELMRLGADDRWSFGSIVFENVPQEIYTSSSTTPAGTLTPSGVSGNITLTASAGTPFASATKGDLLKGNGGIARVLSVVPGSSTVVNAVTLVPFYSTDAIPNTEWSYDTGGEDLWSASRGYPRAVAFYQQRLIFGGFKSKPTTMAASVIDDFYNFDTGILEDDEAFVYTMDTNKSSVIYHLFPHNTLEIFTSGGEFVSVADKTFTPTTVEFRRQSQVGCIATIRPQEVENGGTLYVQKDGRSLSEFIFSDSTLSYENNRISLLASHLMVTPVDGDLRRSTSDEQSNYWMQVNSDGALILAAILEGQNVVAFSRHITDGNFKNCVSVDEVMYVVVERTINGTAKRYIEELKFDRLLDSSSYFLVGALPDPDEVTGLQYLEAKSVVPIIDGSAYPAQTVPASGTIALPETVTSTLEIGIDFTDDVLLETNPIENPQIGPLMGRLKALPDITVNVYETENILVQGYDPFLQQLGTPSTLDASPNQWTDRFRLQGLLGWDQNGIITITQDAPLPMTLLNLAITLNYSTR